MKKNLYLLCMFFILAFTSCADGDENGINGSEEGNYQVEVTYENLLGEWICYYQYWEEGNDSRESSYNTDDLSLTFNEDLSGYLKREHDDELLEIGRSQNFTYMLSDQIIFLDIYSGEKWLITSLTETELTLKRQDEDYIIIAKFVKRKSLSGKVSKLFFKTEYMNGGVYYDTYSFSYDFKGELNGITYGNKSLTYGPYQDDKVDIKWYNGDRLRLVDKKKDGYAEISSLGTVFVVNAQYDTDGFLVMLSDNNQVVEYKYLNGNLSSWEIKSENKTEYKFGYEYSEEKNDANIDLNYFIGNFPSDGNFYQFFNYLELGLEGRKSDNLISKIITPENFDIYFTYVYERDIKDRVYKITRMCTGRHDPYENDLLNKTTIDVEYYNE